MPEGPMNVEPVPAEDAAPEPADSIDVTDVPAGAVNHFPTHAPRLTAGGQSTYNALKPKR
jgi:hypothetical protein